MLNCNGLQFATGVGRMSLVQCALSNYCVLSVVATYNYCRVSLLQHPTKAIKTKVFTMIVKKELDKWLDKETCKISN